MKKFYKNGALVLALSVLLTASLTVNAYAAAPGGKDDSAAKAAHEREVKEKEQKEKEAHEKAQQQAAAKDKAEKEAAQQRAQQQAAKERAEKEAAQQRLQQQQQQAQQAAQQASQRAAKEKVEKEAKEKADREAQQRVIEQKAKEESAKKAVPPPAPVVAPVPKPAPAPVVAPAPAKPKEDTAAKERAEKEAAQQKLQQQQQASRQAAEQASQRAAREKAEKEVQEKAAHDAAQKAKEEAAAKKVAPAPQAPAKPAPVVAPAPVKKEDQAAQQAKEKAEKEAAQQKLQQQQQASQQAVHDAAQRAAKEKVDKEAREKEALQKVEKEKAEKAAEMKAKEEAAAKKAAPVAPAVPVVAAPVIKPAQPAINPVAPPPAIKVKEATPEEQAHKLEKVKRETAAQTTVDQAKHDEEVRKAAHEATIKNQSKGAKDSQAIRESDAQKAAKENAEKVAKQKAEAAKSAAAQTPAVPKTADKVKEDQAKKVEAKQKLGSLEKSAEVHAKNEEKAVEKTAKVIEKKKEVTPQKQAALQQKEADKKAEMKKIGETGTVKLTAQEEAKIAEAKRKLEEKDALKNKKPKVVAPVHAAALVEVKEVRKGEKFGIDPKKQVVVVPLKTPLKPAPRVNGVAVPSHLAVVETQNNIKTANIRTENIHNTIINNKTNKTNVVIVNNITNVTNTYVTNYQTTVIERNRIYDNHYRDVSYRNYYSSYANYGFRGGYAYPVRVVVDIQTHFWNPVVLWLYSDLANREFYCANYGDAYCVRYPVSPFRYARVYYPTDTLRDLGLEVSGMAYYRHTYFRSALEKMTDDLSYQLSRYVAGRFYFGPNDIVINYYRNLGDGEFVVEGFVDRGSLHAAFKGYLNVENPSLTRVFVPDTNNYSPTDAAVAVLTYINARMTAHNVEPTAVAYEEPAPPPLPVVKTECTTFSGKATGQASNVDAGQSGDDAVANCTSKGGNSLECKTNLSCDDGGAYAPVVSCSTTSTDDSGRYVFFNRMGRDADLTSQLMNEECVGSDDTSDVDSCSKNSTCVATDNTVLSQLACAVTAANNPPGTFASYDANKARNRAVEQCVTADGTDVDDCNDEDNLSCDYVAPVQPLVQAQISCRATVKRSGMVWNYPGQGETRKEAYNSAVKKCVAANSGQLAACQSSADQSCPMN